MAFAFDVSFRWSVWMIKRQLEIAATIWAAGASLYNGNGRFITKAAA
jgi:hypothetical protein